MILVKIILIKKLNYNLKEYYENLNNEWRNKNNL